MVVANSLATASRSSSWPVGRPALAHWPACVADRPLPFLFQPSARFYGAAVRLREAVRNIFQRTKAAPARAVRQVFDRGDGAATQWRGGTAIRLATAGAAAYASPLIRFPCQGSRSSGAVRADDAGRPSLSGLQRYDVGRLVGNDQRVHRFSVTTLSSRPSPAGDRSSIAVRYSASLCAAMCRA